MLVCPYPSMLVLLRPTRPRPVTKVNARRLRNWREFERTSSSLTWSLSRPANYPPRHWLFDHGGSP